MKTEIIPTRRVLFEKFSPKSRVIEDFLHETDGLEIFKLSDKPDFIYLVDESGMFCIEINRHKQVIFFKNFEDRLHGQDRDIHYLVPHSVQQLFDKINCDYKTIPGRGYLQMYLNLEKVLKVRLVNTSDTEGLWFDLL